MIFKNLTRHQNVSFEISIILIHLPIHLFNKYLLSTYCVSSITVGASDTTLDKTDMPQLLSILYFRICRDYRQKNKMSISAYYHRRW